MSSPVKELRTRPLTSKKDEANGDKVAPCEDASSLAAGCGFPRPHSKFYWRTLWNWLHTSRFAHADYILHPPQMSSGWIPQIAPGRVTSSERPA